MKNNFIIIESSHGEGTLERCQYDLRKIAAAHLEYSKDGYSWKLLCLGTPINFSTIFIRGVYTPETLIGNLQITGGPTAISGNIMNLVNYNNPNNARLFPFIFEGLFYDSSTLRTAEELELPATALARYCYKSMFHGCTSLTTAPELPATTLAEQCYRSMFYNCTSLTTAPKLLATTLADSCYSNMFNGCASLTTAPELPATTLAISCYYSMFKDCTALTTAPELPATTLANWCYEYMFEGCTSLTIAPELPATTLATSCYDSMFEDCTNLIIRSDIPALTSIERKKYAHHMFRGCVRKYLTRNEFCNHFNAMFKNEK